MTYLSIVYKEFSVLYLFLSQSLALDEIFSICFKLFYQNKLFLLSEIVYNKVLIFKKK